ALISKLENGLNDRLDALLQTRPYYNFAHYSMGAIYNNNFPRNPNFPGPLFGVPGWRALPSSQRAQVIAWYDYIKAEMPGVFFNQQRFIRDYPLNFAGQAYPGRAEVAQGYHNYILPLGHIVAGPNFGGYGDSVTTGSNTNPNLGTTGSGIFGASYTAAAGIY